VNESLFDANLRRTCEKDRAFFEESGSGGERAMRLIRMETLRALDVTYAGRKAGGMGTAEIGDEMEIEHFELSYDPGRQGWAFDGEFYSIVSATRAIRNTQQRGCALSAKSKRKVPGLLSVAKPTHIVGVDGETKYVARKLGNLVTWFNHSSGFLMAAGVERSHETRTNRSRLHREKPLAHWNLARSRQSGRSDGPRSLP